MLKKKVLLTINNSKLSGIEMFTLLLARHINSDIYSIIVGIPTQGPVCKVFEDNNIDFFVFENGRNGSYTIKGIINLFRNMSKNRYDIVHSQAGISPCLLGMLLRVKKVIEHRHGLDFAAEQLENMKPMKKIYESLKMHFVDLTLTGCRRDKLVLVNKFGFDSEKIEVVYNGIEDSNSFRIKDPGEKIIIGTIGRLTYQKGQEFMIEAARQLNERYENCEFHIYGDGELFEEYKIKIKNFRLEKKIFLKGYAIEPSAAMNSFDIFLLPSRYEGIPYVILSAMSIGVPVIATDVGGVNEVIRHLKNGILVKRDSPDEIAASVTLLIEDKILRENIVREARNDFVEKFTIEKTIEQMESIYEEMN